MRSKPKFLPRKSIESCIHHIIDNASDYVFLVSAYLKLNDKIKEELLILNKRNVRLRVLIRHLSEKGRPGIREEDYRFFLRFNNIQIRNHEDLHAKYYANEHEGLLSSLNLHEYSLANNIEGGVYSFGHSFDKEANNYFNNVWNKAIPILHIDPIAERCGILRRKTKVVGADKKIDLLGKLY